MKSEIKQRISIGGSSLILIFIILCLATFALLSLSSAVGDRNLAEKSADAVRGYYQADREGERFVRMAAQTAAAVYGTAGDADRLNQMLAEQLGQSYQPDTKLVKTEIPMDFDQVLRIGLLLDEDGNYSIQSWKVSKRTDYEIDDSICVWDGSDS